MTAEADKTRAAARRLVEQAVAGDLRATESLFDMVFGPPAAPGLEERLAKIERLVEGRHSLGAEGTP
ncbi:MAG: hypothetical protein HQ582_06485 [Planctomycetes bacterium]|nr:hypothetical protein [Planctomycetota bacterium]